MVGFASLYPPYELRALQRLAIPLRQIGGAFVGVLQEAEQQRVGIAREPHRLVGQDELPEVLIVVAVRGAQRRVAVTLRLRIGIDVKRRLSEAAVARPKTAARDFVRIG